MQEQKTILSHLPPCYTTYSSISNITPSPSFKAHISLMAISSTPDWERERILHHSTLTQLGLLPIPDWVPRRSPSDEVVVFPLPTYRCPFLQCPLCVPHPHEDAHSANTPAASAPTRPPRRDQAQPKSIEPHSTRVSKPKRSGKANAHKKGSSKAKVEMMAKQLADLSMYVIARFLLARLTMTQRLGDGGGEGS